MLEGGTGSHRAAALERTRMEPMEIQSNDADWQGGAMQMQCCGGGPGRTSRFLSDNWIGVFLFTCLLLIGGAYEAMPSERPGRSVPADAPCTIGRMFAPPRDQHCVRVGARRSSGTSPPPHRPPLPSAAPRRARQGAPSCEKNTDCDSFMFCGPVPRGQGQAVHSFSHACVRAPSAWDGSFRRHSGPAGFRAGSAPPSLHSCERLTSTLTCLRALRRPPPPDAARSSGSARAATPSAATIAAFRGTPARGAARTTRSRAHASTGSTWGGPTSTG